MDDRGAGIVMQPENVTLPERMRKAGAPRPWQRFATGFSGLFPAPSAKQLTVRARKSIKPVLFPSPTASLPERRFSSALHALTCCAFLPCPSLSSLLVPFPKRSHPQLTPSPKIRTTHREQRRTFPFQLSPKALLRHARRSDYIFSSKTLTILRTYGTCFRGF